MSEQILVMDDGWMGSSLCQNPYLVLSSACDEPLSWTIKNWMKKHLVSDNNCNNVNLQSPRKNKVKKKITRDGN